MIKIFNTSPHVDSVLHSYSIMLANKLDELKLDQIQLFVGVELDMYDGVDLDNLHGMSIIFEVDGRYIILDWNDSELEALQELEASPFCDGVISVNRAPSDNLFNTELPYVEKYYRRADDYFSNHYESHFDSLINHALFSGVVLENRSKFFTDITGVIDCCFSNNRLEPDVYFDTLKKFKLVLSPPGGCDISHRDIECFGLGIPIVRPEYTIPTTKLIPQQHYISSEYLKYVRNDIYQDKDLLFAVSRNSRQYYVENCLYPIIAYNACMMHIQNVKTKGGYHE